MKLDEFKSLQPKRKKPSHEVGKHNIMHDTFTQYVKAETGLFCVREYFFHPVREWRFDYAIPFENDSPYMGIAIEVEGGAWSNGRHTRGKGFIGDMEKYNEATCLGWKLLRVTPDQLMTLKTIEYIKKLTK